MKHLDRAIAYDRDDRPIEAIREYEAALASQESLRLEDYLNLAMLYTELFDYGFVVHHGIDHRDVPDPFGKAMECLDRAEEYHGPDTAIDFLRLYIPWDTVYTDVPDGAMEALAARGDSPLPGFFLFSTTRDERYRAPAQALLQQVDAGDTAMKRRIKGVLTAALAPRRPGWLTRLLLTFTSRPKGAP